METQQSATPQGLDQRSKMEEVLPKMARRKGSNTESQGGGESDPEWVSAGAA